MLRGIAHSMASLSGAQFNITGASGTASTLVAESGWFAYVLPRGAHAAADSTGVDITLDSTSASDRFAANNWVQIGTDISKIRRVTLSGSASIRVNSAVVVSENDRVFLIGNTQPSTTGSSATYIIPASIIRKRDDSAADIYTNSLVTSNSDGLVQFWCAPNFYDVLIQDGNQSLQGSIIDLPVGSVGGISTDVDALFGGSVTVNGALGVTGWATFGSTVTLNAALGVTGWAHFGASVTMHANAGVTGTLTVGATSTFTGKASFGNSVSIDGALGITGSVTLGANGVIGGLSVTTGIFGVSNQPRCFVSTLASYSVPFSTTVGITFDTEDQDVGGMFTPSGSSTRITIPAGGGGVYIIHAELPWLATAGESGSRFMRFFKNGVQISQTTVHGSTNTGSYIAGECNTIDVAAAGDYYELTALHTVGVTTEVGTGSGAATFRIVKVS